MTHTTTTNTAPRHPVSFWRQLVLGTSIGAAAGTLYSVFAFNLLVFVEMDSVAEWFADYLPTLATSFFVALVGAPVGAVVGLFIALLMLGVQRFSPLLWQRSTPIVGTLSALLVCVPLQAILLLNYDFSDRYGVESWAWRFGMWVLFAGIPTLLALWIGSWAASVLRLRETSTQ